METSSDDDDEKKDRESKAKQFKLENLGQEVWKRTAEESKLTEQERELIKAKAENDVEAFIKKIEEDHKPNIDAINTKTMEFYKKKIREVPKREPSQEELERKKAKEEKEERIARE